MTFTIRDIKSKLTNTQYLAITLIEAPILALILAFFIRYFNVDAETSRGYIYGDNENVPIYMFMSVVVALFIGLSVSAEEIIRDRKIQKRESFLNLSRSSYLISKIGIMFMLSAIQTITFLLVGNLLLGIKDMWMDYWLVLFTASCFANMLGLNISSSFNTAVTIYILIPFLIIPQLLFSGVMVKFDKLNPVVAEQGGVPWIGEAMASRWAFEALAVNQFKANKYEKQFYVFDQAISEVDYKNTYWSAKMEAKIAKIERELGNTAKKNELENDVNLVRKEFQKEGLLHKTIAFKNADQITTAKITPELLKDCRTYLTGTGAFSLTPCGKTLKQFYIDRNLLARKKKDDLTSKLNQTPEQKIAFSKLREQYENDALNNFVRNSQDLGDKCIEKDGKLIQRVDPVFLDPSNNNGSAHFYAPHKKLFGTFYPTFAYNLCIIWSMSIFMMITLYFDALKKLLDFFGNIPALFKRRRK
jgi:hypothetical protein